MEQIPPVPTLPAPASSLAARLTNIFVSPGDVFEEVKVSPPTANNWLVPVLLLAVIGVISTFVIFSQPAMMQQIREQQAKVFDQQVKAGKMTQSQADQAMAMAANVFTFWQLGVMAAGLARLAISSFARAFAWLLAFWLVVEAALILFSVAVAHLVTLAK